MTAGYRSRVTCGAGGVSLLTAGEKHTDVGQDPGHVVVPDTVSFKTFQYKYLLDQFYLLL